MERILVEKKNEGKYYGYARVSTKDQNEDRQLIALANAGMHMN